MMVYHCFTNTIILYGSPIFIGVNRGSIAYFSLFSHFMGMRIPQFCKTPLDCR